MPLRLITDIAGTCVSIPGDDVDTDRIVPQRFLKCITFEEMGEALFYDERFWPDGTPKEHPLNEPGRKGAAILIAGRNFGCGSSREHAPQAIFRHGFRAVVAESFAEIFFGNATTLGIPCVSVSRGDLAAIRELAAAGPDWEMEIDLVSLAANYAGDIFRISIPESARDALIHGRWDAIGELLDGEALVDQRASALPYLQVCNTPE